MYVSSARHGTARHLLQNVRGFGEKGRNRGGKGKKDRGISRYLVGELLSLLLLLLVLSLSRAGFCPCVYSCCVMVWFGMVWYGMVCCMFIQ